MPREWSSSIGVILDKPVWQFWRGGFYVAYALFVDGLVLSGDFFMEPAEALGRLQEALVGVRHDPDAVLRIVKEQLAIVDAPGLDAADVTAAVMAAAPR